MEELLQLTRENNAMLKRICAWLDKIESPQYRDNEDIKAFVSNFAANIAYDRCQGFPVGQSMGVNNPTSQQSNSDQIFWR